MMMTTSRHISWEQLSDRIALGIPFVHRVPAPRPGLPPLDIRVSEHGKELALWIPTGPGASLSVSPLAMLAIEVLPTPAGQVIEIRTRTPPLFQDIYGFFVSIIDKIQLNDAAPSAALTETVDAWRDLLQAQSILSDEAQLGLRGELQFMRHLVARIGDEALAAWTGPHRQPHDFRVGVCEFEVKTTRGVGHVHVINGIHQLEPSPDHQLFIYSVRLAPSGAKAGTTLPEDIDQTRDLLSPTGKLRLDRVLRTQYGYVSEHADWYPQRLQPASLPRLVLVDAACPRLTSEMLSTVPHFNLISDLRYRVNLDGMGYPEGSIEYEALLNAVA